MNSGSLSSCCWELTQRKKNTMIRSRAPLPHGAWICGFGITTTSSTCCRHGPRLCNARKQNHDNKKLWFLVIMVSKVHAKRRKHDEKELNSLWSCMEFGFATLKTWWQAKLVVIMDLGPTMLEKKTMTMTNSDSFSLWC